MRILFAAAALLAATTPVHADPITLVATVVASLLSSLPIAVTAPIIASIGITAAAQAIGAALVIGGLAAASFLFSPTRSGVAIDPGQLKETFEGEESAEINAVGRVRLGGVKIFGNTNEEDRFRLIGQCKGPIDLVEETYLGGQEVVLEPATGEVMSPPYRTSGGDSFIIVNTKIGDGTETAWTDLISFFPQLWTAAHRVRGIAQALAHYISPGFTNPLFVKFYQSGAPNLEQVLRAQLVYDPRTETTVWSDNGILCALHVMLTWPDFTIDDFDLDFIRAEADRADLPQLTEAGTMEPRSRCWGVWTSETPRQDVMDQLLRSIGAEIVPRPDDTLGIALIDDDRVAEVTIPLRHIIDLKWRSGPESVERPNLCRVKYYSPERVYEMSEIDLTGIAWARSEEEIARVGEKPIDIDLPFCPSASQAQRIARRLFETARADAGIAITNMVGLAVWGTRAVAFELPDDLGTPVTAIAPPRVRDADGEVEIPFVVWPSLPPWNPSVDEAAAPAVLPQLASADPLDPPDAPGAATVVTNGDGTFIRVAIGPFAPLSTRAEVAYRTMLASGHPATAWRPLILWLPPGIGFNQITMAYAEDDLTGILSEFRDRVFNAADERGSQWSATSVATPAVNDAQTNPPTIFASYDDVVTTSLVVTAPAQQRVAYIEMTGTGVGSIIPATIPCKPLEQFSYQVTTAPSGPAHQECWTAQAFTTNGTGSTIAQDCVDIPGG
ncbi:MAG: hypothetical protein GEU91_18445 [Rhizobiales bacterium]|nr:hypothetical protein [Hyphomicrobiales bacterium]